MSILVEGLGDDWIVTRKPGGTPEITTFESPEDLLQKLQSVVTTSAFKEARPLPIAVPVPPPPPVVAKPATVAVELDCRKCGACCAPMEQASDTHVLLGDGDLTSVAAVIRDSLTSFHGGARYMSTKRNDQGLKVCSALKGKIGDSCKCTIYEQRPLNCKIFEPGSDECLAARERFGVS